jgi:hypothetical protein
MTCTHVLALIEAVPFEDYPRAHLDAAWLHARACVTCGPALQRATELATNLVALPLPKPSSEFATTVMARIAQVEQAQPAQVAAQGASMARDWPAWAAAPGALAGGVVLLLSMTSEEMPMMNLTSSVGTGVTGWLSRPMSTNALVLAAALVLYAAGLFAPLSRRHRG